MAKPVIHVASMNVEVILPKETDTATASQTAARIVTAVREYTLDPVETHVHASDTMTWIAVQVVSVKPMTDPHELLASIELATV